MSDEGRASCNQEAAHNNHDESGVSTTTVSHILNGHETGVMIREATRQKNTVLVQNPRHCHMPSAGPAPEAQSP